MCRDLFLLGEFGLSNLVTTEDNVEHTLHVSEKLLIRCRSAALEVCDDGRGRVALGCKIFLRHGGAFVVFRLGTRFRDGLADNGTDGLGLDDVIGAVYFGKTLTFAGSTLGSVREARELGG